MNHYDRDELAVTLFEESGDALFLFDPASEAMIDANPMAQRLSGFPYAELLRLKVTYLFRSGTAGGLQRLRHAFQRTGLFHSQEDFLLRHAKEGVWVPVNMTVTRLHARPKTLGLITVRDISERKKLEKSLLHERYLLHSLLDNIPDQIYFKDVQGSYIRINKAKAQLHGLRCPDDAVNKSDFDYFPEEFARKTLTDEKRVMETGQPLIAQVEDYLDKYGHKQWISATKSPLRDAKGEIVGTFGISRDITEQKELEEQLRQSQKIEAIGQLAGGVAHDFNNLLTIIIGHVSLLLEPSKRADSDHEPLLVEQSRLADSVCDGLRIIHDTAERAAALTRQLLAFSRKQLITPVVINLNTVISGMAPMLCRLIGENIRLHTDLARELGPIKADRNQLEQVFMNLVVNARDAMPMGGLLTIETREERGQVVLTVRDTGHGMDEHTRAHLFEPFFTTKEVGKGTGLGLATVYGIVQQSGGSISVDSAPGAGATFRIEMPCVTDRGEPQAPAGANGELPSVVTSNSHHASRRETILLVEDEEMVRNLSRIVLRKHGYTVLEGAHGAEALAICQSHKEPIDLLVTDVIMPGMSGRELADQFALIRPNTKVLFVSGYTDDAVVRNGIFADGVQFLHKPFTPDTLAAKVREVLDNRPSPRSDPGSRWV